MKLFSNKKMVLIFSIEEEETTSSVMDWLGYYNSECKRINTNNFFINNEKATLEITNNYSHFGFDVDLWNVQDITSVWIRRIPYRIIDYPILNKINSNYIYGALRYHLNDELEKWFYGMLDNILKKGKKTVSGNIDRLIINKLSALKIAIQSDLKIPATIITSSKSDLEDFKFKFGRIITKSVSDPQSYALEDYGINLYSYTEEITDKLIGKYSEKMFPTLAQQYIDKEYELRVFYLNQKCYSMCIFSQQSEKTQMDYRKQDKQKPNRWVPYQLPVKIENKISVFMKKINTDNGSIDLIKARDGEYYFLEINALGFFNMVSYPCNYFLERELAKVLSE